MLLFLNSFFKKIAMNIAEKIYETVKTLPEQQAAEVLDYAEKLKNKGLETVDKSEPGQADFFSVAGIWQGRDVTEASLRDLAWRNNAG